MKREKTQTLNNHHTAPNRLRICSVAPISTTCLLLAEFLSAASLVLLLNNNFYEGSFAYLHLRF